MKELDQKTLQDRIEGYLDRMKKHNSSLCYALDERGLYEVIGGSDIDITQHVKNNYFKGRFIDAIIYALHQPEFYASWCGENDMWNCNHGFVRKAELPKREIFGPQVALEKERYAIIKRNYASSKKNGDDRK